MKNLTPLFWIILGVSIISGVLIARIDTSPNWDDTGITVGAIMIISFVTGVIRPFFAWLWALIIGGCVFGFNVALNSGYASAMAIVFAFAGAYTGFVVRKFMD